MTNQEIGFSTDLLWNTLWESTNDGLIVVNPDGYITASNKAVDKTFGMRLVGLNLQDLFEAIELSETDQNRPLTTDDFISTRALRGEKTPSKRRFIRNAARPEGFYTETTGHTLRNAKGKIFGAFVVIRDITDFVRQEQESQQKYEKLFRESEAMLEAIPDMIFRISKDEIHLDLRSSKKDDLLAPRNEMIGSSLEDQLADHYDALPKFREAVQLALKSRNLQKIEYTLKFDDELRYFEGRIVPSGSDEVIALVRNISLEHQQQVLRELSEKRYRLLVENIPDILFRMSMDGEFLDIHTPDENYLMLPKDKLLGNKIQQTHPEYSVSMWEESRDALKKNGQMQFAEYSLEINGKEQYFDRRMVSSGADEMLMIIRNISERKRAEHELKQSEARFRSIAEAMTNPVVISRIEDGVILYANQRMYDAFKVQDGELLGERAEKLYVRPEERKKLVSDIKKHGRLINQELEMLRPNGEHIWILFSASTLNYLGEEAIIASYVDITEWRITQAQLVQASKMAAIGEMSAGVAHEINTPLSTMRLSVDNIRQALKKGEINAAEKSLQLIDDEVTRTNSIISQMLSFSRDTENQQREIFDVRTVFLQVILMLKNQLEQLGIEILIKLGGKLQLVYGYPVQLQQVVFNLAINARDALSGTEAKKIEFRLKRRTDKIFLEIEDNGSGIAPEIRQRIFNPFFTTKSSGQGTGLGLSVSQKIINAHSGIIECKSANTGKGALFRVTLPLAEG